jgi:hypothetical protein
MFVISIPVFELYFAVIEKTYGGKCTGRAAMQKARESDVNPKNYRYFMQASR